MRVPPLHQLHLGPLDGMDIPPTLLALNAAYLKFPVVPEAPMPAWDPTPLRAPGTMRFRTVTYERARSAVRQGDKRKPAFWYRWNPDR
jgi:hypothetical protein